MAEKLTPSQDAPEAGAWKTVPVEPTDKMVFALAAVLLGRVNAPEQEIYHAASDGLAAALAASPSPPPVVGEQGSLLKEAEEALRGVVAWADDVSASGKMFQRAREALARLGGAP